ncbi:MAG: hypothetical protein OHK0017_07240 [Patescibacteria group bacterium]
MLLKNIKIRLNFRRSLGLAMILSGLSILSLMSIPNNLLPDSFPRFFENITPSVLPARDSVPIFDPNYVMSDVTFRSTRDFPNVASVQKYLEKVNSPLARFSENGRSAAQIIFQSARGELKAPSKANATLKPNLNPAVILTKLETEQSLLSLRNYDIKSDPERRIAKAMGYACYDFEACDDSLKGFTNQVATAAWQLEYNFQLASSGPASEPYRQGKTIVTLDERKVYLTNPATAAFYRYTPHVYWGNYNVWKVIIANGWGINSDNWSQEQLDAANVPIKESVEVKPVNYGLKFSDVSSLLAKSFPLSTQSEEVLKLQKYLRQTGYYTRVPNGFYGAPTKYAQDSFRKERNIKITAYASGQDASVVDKQIVPDAQPASTGASCDSLLAKSYRSGQMGEDVKQLQQCLRDLGYFNYPTNTGKVGSVTVAALNKYKSGSKTSTPAPNPKTTTKLKDVSGLEFWGYKCSSMRTSNFKFGETGNRVKALQFCMVSAGIFDKKNTTGNYWYKTDQALVSWRKS